MIHIHPRNILSAVTLAWTILLPSILPAQNKSESSATTVTRSNIGNVVTSRRDSHDNNSRKNTADTRWDAPNPNVEWMRIIYRQIDLDILETFSYLYQLENGHTWYVQSILNRLYEKKISPIDNRLVDRCINDILDEQETIYQSNLTLLTNNQVDLLKAIATEGCIDRKSVV